MTDQSYVPFNVRHLRRARGWSQTRLGRRAGGLGQRLVSDIERGLFVPDDRLARLARALGVTTDDLTAPLSEPEIAAARRWRWPRSSRRASVG